MKEEDIKPFDWHRILIGEVPGEFYIEVIFRTLVVFALLMIAMRLMGKRMASQLSRIEMIAMTSLAAAIGIPIQSADRGVIPALIIGFIVVVTQQFIARKASRNEKFEALTQDNFDVLVEDGRLRLDRMLETRLTRERVFGQLRTKGIVHLGEVKRLYFEANGSFTIVDHPHPLPGLSIIPPFDLDFLKKRSQEASELVCNQCGSRRSQQDDSQQECRHCNFNDWVSAVMTA